MGKATKSDGGKGAKVAGPGTVLRPVIIGGVLLTIINVALTKVL